MTIFEKNYSNLYDLLYLDKPYDAEVLTINNLIKNNLGSGSYKILDVGCGTGNHSFRLAKSHQVIGLDKSADMLENASKKNQDIKWIKGDATSFILNDHFDVVIMMAAVLGYQHYNINITNTLYYIHKHLVPNGLFIFDVWYGPTVIKTGVTERIKVVNNGDTKFIRLAKGQLFELHNLCKVDYNIWNTSTGEETIESHMMRYFFPVEIELFLYHAGFEILKIGQCPMIDIKPSYDSWHMMVAARAI